MAKETNLRLGSLINCADSPPCLHTQYVELAMAVLQFASKPLDEWTHEAIVALAEAHAEDSQTVDSQTVDERA